MAANADETRRLSAVTATGVTLYWLPLGAGGRCVRRNGRLFEALMARREHRAVRDLYHSALEVRLGGDRFVIEMTPVLGGGTADRGVVRDGPVADRLAAGPQRPPDGHHRPARARARPRLARRSRRRGPPRRGCAALIMLAGVRSRWLLGTLVADSDPTGEAAA